MNSIAKMDKTKVLAIALVLSLVVIVALLMRGPSRPAPIPATIYSLSKNQVDFMLRNLPEDRRKELRASMSKEYDELRMQSENVVRERRALSQLLEQEKLDQNNVNSILNAIRESQGKAEEISQRMLTSMLTTLSPEERRQALRANKRPPQDRPRRNRDKNK